MDIKRIFKKYGTNQKEIAAKLGINRVTLNITLSHGDNIKLSTLRRIAAAVGCNVIEFFEDEKGTPAAVHETGTPAAAVCPWCGKPLVICKGDQSEE